MLFPPYEYRMWNYHVADVLDYVLQAPPLPPEVPGRVGERQRD